MKPFGNRIAATLCTLLVGGSAELRATEALYQNDGTINSTQAPPQIDALAFVNNGSMTLQTFSSPYETRNTLNYTNYGTITALPGITFETIDFQSKRTRAASFVSPAGSLISVQASSGFSFGGNVSGFRFSFGPGQNPFHDYEASTLRIAADKIDIAGELDAAPGSGVELAGGSVKLVNAGIHGAIFDNAVQGFTYDSTIPPDGTDDFGFEPKGFTVRYAGGDAAGVGISYGALAQIALDKVTNSTLSGPVVTTVTNATATTPFFPINNNPRSGQFFTSGGLGSRTALISTNWSDSSGTNQTIFAAFLGSQDPGVLVDFGNAGFGTQRLLIGTTVTNVISGGVDLVTLTLDSNFIQSQDSVILPLDSDPLRFWPSNIVVTRWAVTPIPISRDDIITGAAARKLSASNLVATMRTQFGVQAFSNAPFRANLFTEALVPTNMAVAPAGFTNPLVAVSFTNAFATNPYTGFSFSFTTTPSRTELVNSNNPAFFTNNLGKVSIEADTLDMTRTRIQTEGPVIIKAKDLLSTKGAAVEAPYLSMDLGNSAGDLKIDGLIKPQHETLSGTISYFASSWTNSAFFQNVNSTNTPPDVASADVAFRFFVARVEVTRSTLTRLHSLTLNSRKVTISDSGTILGLLAANTEDLVINGKINVADVSTSRDLGSSLTSLRTLTLGTNSSLIVPSLINLGSPAAGRLDFVKILGSGTNGPGGLLRGRGVRIDSQLVEVGPGATLNALNGPLFLNADRLSISNSGTGTKGLVTTGPSFVTAKQLSLSGASINSSVSSLNLGVTDVLSAPASSPSSLSISAGLELTTRPTSVDVSGLAVTIAALPYTEIPFVWTGPDVGAVVAGFSNPQNMGIKSLTINGDYFSTIDFRGPDSKNALYVGQLVFQGSVVTFSTNNGVVTPDLGYIQQLINVDPNFTIYFSSAVTASGVDISDALDRAIPERLRLVKLPVGGAASLPVTLDNGSVIQVPSSLLYSSEIDSDGDGIANLWDATPFSGLRLSVVTTEVAGEKLVKLSFAAGAGGKYAVEASANLGQWTLVQSVENTASETQTIELLDKTSALQGARTYRVRYDF